MRVKFLGREGARKVLLVYPTTLHEYGQALDALGHDPARAARRPEHGRYVVTTEEQRRLWGLPDLWAAGRACVMGEAQAFGVLCDPAEWSAASSFLTVEAPSRSAADNVPAALVVRSRTPRAPVRVPCLAGPAGTGKRSLSAAVAEALGRPHVEARYPEDTAAVERKSETGTAQAEAILVALGSGSDGRGRIGQPVGHASGGQQVRRDPRPHRIPGELDGESSRRELELFAHSTIHENGAEPKLPDGSHRDRRRAKASRGSDGSRSSRLRKVTLT